MSRNSTATTISMHGIVSLLKPRRALWHGYTLPKRWSRHVEITCGLHHMRLRHLRYPPGHIHAIIRRLALSGSVYQRSARSPWTQGKNLPEPDSANRLNIDQLWWVLHCLSVLPGEKIIKISRWIFLKSNTRSNSANPCWMMCHVKPPWEERA